ncbi:MAG: bifunctional UDP-N-acetylglucosamine diphosphorylase/glucosamine-1-phosphate N-acetyltransferase GlmU [Venatoribacter sp.]
MNLAVVTLAAGKGSRMKSDLPKVLHKLAGKPMLMHVLSSAQALGNTQQHVVIGHGADKVKEQITGFDITWALQAEQKGTGHAVAQAMPNIANDATVLILYGDVPLIRTQTLQKLLAETSQNQSLALLTVKLDNPSGYGRIVRNSAGQVQAIVEHKDASPEQLSINEVNTGILAVSAQHLNTWLPQLSANNAQGEYYLTDIIAMAVSQGVAVNTIHPQDEHEVQGVNDRLQMAQLERVYQQAQAEELMRQGVSLADPSRLDVRGSLKVGNDVSIDVGCVFEGEVVLEDGVSVGPYCVIKNSHIGTGTQLEAFCHIEQAQTQSRCSIGPYARLRPGADLRNQAKVGNFCEVKKAVVGEGSKVNHLTYIGDAEIGQNANIGAGTITCNYDGVNKFKTEIGDNAFIGSNTALVAPVKVGAGATVGAGSTITKDVEAEQLAVARGKQRNIDGWPRPTKH